MRIAFDHQIFGWQRYGGISRYALELAMGLSGHCGQDVRVVCPLYVNRYLEQAQSELLMNGWRVPVFRYSGRIYRALNSILAVPAMRRFRPDIVHETYYSSNSSAPRRAAVVITVHDMIHERFPENFSPRDPTRREKAAAVSRADHIICISEQTKSDLIEFLGVADERISIVHHGFALATRGDSLSVIQPPERPYLLYVGSRTGHKNFAGLIKAYASSPRLNESYELVCFGGGGLTAQELSMVDASGLSLDRVRHVSGDDALLEHYYRHARAFIYPSLYEGFGIPPLEAMSFECPVVCSNMSSIPEVVGDAAQMFDPSSTESIRVAMEQVVDDEELRNDLIRRGSLRLGMFSWNRCAERTLDIYRRVIA